MFHNASWHIRKVKDKLFLTGTAGLESQASEILTQVRDELVKIGINVEIDQSSIKLPGYSYPIVRVEEGSRLSGKYSFYLTGKIELYFPTVHTGNGSTRYRAFNAKHVKGDTKNLISKVVSDIKERVEAIQASLSREKKSNQAAEEHHLVLDELRCDYSKFAKNIEESSLEIKLSFRNLTEEQARVILSALQNANLSL